MAPKLSVIVPVYNASSWLRRCVDSVLEQPFRDFELILVDDGSRDSSGTICDEFAARDGRVQVIHQVNTGVSAARNVGIKSAQGEYLQFVDSDDWLEENYSGALLAAAEQSGADVVIAGFRTVQEMSYSSKKPPEYEIRQARELTEAFDPFYFSMLLNSPCNKVYRRELVQVGFPEDVGEFYRLDDYEGYCWTVHGRYPTNTPGWWGGAHPFTLLDWSIVHNGEISSYDANRRFIEMFGYKCTLQTDTEVITYIMDYLIRVQGLTLGEAASVIAAPFWSTIQQKTDLIDKEKHLYLRTVFSNLLITGPFSIVLGFNGGLMALNDRLKLRSMVVGEKDDKVFIASEEAAIRTMEPNAENIWAPAGGEPVIIQVKDGAY